ncbi:MAG: hypothetical protein ACLPX9_05890 [Rhodomicrobium sp.]
MTQHPDDELLDLLEDLLDCVDPQTAFVLEAIFSLLVLQVKKSNAAYEPESGFRDLCHALLACRDTACEAALIAPGSFDEVRKAQKRLIQ